MRILRRTFTLLSICGSLRPLSWTSPSKKFLYDVYTVCVLLAMHCLAISQILDLFLNVENQDEFSENLYSTLAVIVSCFKIYSILITRENIVILIDTLQREPFQPMDVEEIKIRTRFDEAAEWNTKAYAISLASCILWMCTMSLIADFGSKKLTFRAWIPFDYSSPLTFSVVYAHQTITTLMCSLCNIAFDSLFSGLLVHIYSQFEILGYRLRNIQRNENESVKQCAHHHNYIYKFAMMVNEEFKVIVLIQFLMSTSLICFNLYRLTLIETGSEIVEIMFYASCTLLQIFYYCWYGNEVKLKSLEVRDMVFECDWAFLNNNTKKILLMIMTRATMSIEFTSVYIVSVNIESFKMLLKTSYSAYNLLQQSK